MVAYTGNLITTRNRGDAVPWNTETDALAAIMEHKVADPGGAYAVREYPEGFYVLVIFTAGGINWLTQQRQPERRVKGMSLTLDELIAAALDAKARSPLGGETVVHHCENDREYISATRAVLDTDPEHPEDGAVFLVCI